MDSEVTPRITLDPELGLTELAKLRQQLLECMDGTGPVTLSAAEVKRIGTPALQVLASFAVDCKRRGRSVNWQDISPEFADAVRLLGLGSTLAI